MYFGDGDGFGTNQIVRVRKDGSGRATFVSLASDVFRSMLISGTFLYWAGQAGVRGCPLTGCTVPQVITNDPRPRDLTTLMVSGSARSVVWLNDVEHRVSFLQLDGGVGVLTPLTATAGAESCVQVRSAPPFDFAYVTDPGADRLLSLPRIGVVKPVLSNALTCMLAVTANRVVYGDLGHIRSAAITPNGLATPVVVADLKGPPPESLATDDRHVYWHITGSNGPSVLRVGVDGVTLTPEVFVDGFDYTTGIALDADWLYFVTSGNSGIGSRIWKVAK